MLLPLHHVQLLVLVELPVLLGGGAWATPPMESGGAVGVPKTAVSAAGGGAATPVAAHVARHAPLRLHLDRAKRVGRRDAPLRRRASPRRRRRGAARAARAGAR